MSNLKELEEKSLYTLREAQSRFKNLAALWSTGKDSTVMVALARKAFFGRVPFPLIHIDNGIDFPETYEFRERLAKEWGLEVLAPRSVIKDDLSGVRCCGSSAIEPPARSRSSNARSAPSPRGSLRRSTHSFATVSSNAPVPGASVWPAEPLPFVAWDISRSPICATTFPEGGPCSRE